MLCADEGAGGGGSGEGAAGQERRTVQVFGGNERGQLGNGTLQLSVRPETLQSGELAEHDIVDLSAGGAHTAAVTAKGAVLC